MKSLWAATLWACRERKSERPQRQSSGEIPRMLGSVRYRGSRIGWDSAAKPQLNSPHPRSDADGGDLISLTDVDCDL